MRAIVPLLLPLTCAVMVIGTDAYGTLGPAPHSAPLIRSIDQYQSDINQAIAIRDSHTQLRATISQLSAKLTSNHQDLRECGNRADAIDTLKKSVNRYWLLALKLERIINRLERARELNVLVGLPPKLRRRVESVLGQYQLVLQHLREFSMALPQARAISRRGRCIESPGEQSPTMGPSWRDVRPVHIIVDNRKCAQKHYVRFGSLESTIEAGQSRTLTVDSTIPSFCISHKPEECRAVSSGDRRVFLYSGLIIKPTCTSATN